MGQVNTGNSGELQAISEELAVMRRRISSLTERVVALEQGRAVMVGGDGLSEEGAVQAVPGGSGFHDWLAGGAVLQKIATISFMLVFALLLRTVTDYGYINLGAGTILGIGYVTVLVGCGFWLYRQNRPLAPVFAGGGFLLLFAIVVEGLNRFATLSSAAAYLVLLVALATGSFLALRFTAPRLLAVTVVGVVVAGLAGNFPHLVFPAAAGLLLAANLVAVIGDRHGVAPGLKWWVTLFTLLFWALWVFKVYMAWRHGQPLEPFYPGWYLPLLLLFGGFYLAEGAIKYFRPGNSSAYEAVLPSLNMILLFVAGRVLVVQVWEAGVIFGLLAVGLATAHLVAGWRLSLRDNGGCGATGGAMVAGALMLALGLPQLLGGMAWALPGLAMVAYGLTRLSGRCDSAVIRVVSYLYQFFGLLMGVAGGVFTAVKESQLPASLASALAIGLFALAQYRWCRRHPPGGDSLYFRLDEGDHSAVLLLLCGLGGLYFFGAVLLENFASTMLADPANTVRCGRSLLINFGALVMLLLGSRRRLPELLWVAAALAVVGCIKVFLGDLFKGSGLPLVLSVLSFGVVAATGSVIMGKWQRAVAGATGD